MHIKYSRKSILHPVLSWTPTPRVDGVGLDRERSHSAPGGPKKEFSLRRQIRQSINLAYLDMATRTTRKEITLPPEIVALVFSFRPAEGHTGRREWVIKGCLHLGCTMIAVVARMSFSGTTRSMFAVVARQMRTVLVCGSQTARIIPGGPMR